MLAKIIDIKSKDYNEEYNVRRMNYDQVVVNYPGGEKIKVYDNKDIEFISENDVDKFLLSHRDLLMIKLNRGISVIFYKAILEVIEGQLNIVYENLIILKDKYSVNKRGIWEKEIIVVINKKIPVKILASGQNFKKSGFNINLQHLSKEEFINICSFEIEKIEKEIDERNLILSRYGMAMESVSKEIITAKLIK